MKNRYYDSPVKSRSWQEIEAFYSDYRPGMKWFIGWLYNSRYSFGLFAITSIDVLIIGQSETFDINRNVIRLREIDSKFYLTFLESESSGTTKIFAKGEIVRAFERLLASLNWFTER